MGVGFRRKKSGERLFHLYFLLQWAEILPGQSQGIIREKI